MASEALVEQQEGAKRATFMDVLRHKGFRNLWVGQIVSQVGDYFAFLATMVVVSGFSKDAQSTTLAVSGMLLAQSLPRLLFGMLAGVFVDRWDRRRTMIASDWIRAALTLMMIPAFMSRNLLAMYALGLIMSSVSTLFRPAEQAIIPKLVPKELLTSANSLAQTSFMLAVLVGPALAGGTMKAAGTGNEWVAFIVDSASFVVSAIAIWLISVPKDESLSPQSSVLSPEQGPVKKVWDELLAGLKMLVLNRTVSTLTGIAAITMLGVGAVNVLWVVFLKTKFGFEGSELAWRLGVLDIAFAAGMIAASVVTGNFLSHLAPKWFIVASLAGVGISLAGFAYLPDYWTFMAASVVLGTFVAPINTGMGTMIQVIVPNSKLGRVNGGIGTVTEASTLISMSMAGVLGAALGIPTVFVLGGLICLAMGMASWALLPGITLKDKAEAETSADEQGQPDLISISQVELLPVEDDLVKAG